MVGSPTITDEVRNCITCRESVSMVGSPTITDEVRTPYNVSREKLAC